MDVTRQRVLRLLMNRRLVERLLMRAAPCVVAMDRLADRMPPER